MFRCIRAEELIYKKTQTINRLRVWQTPKYMKAGTNDVAELK